MTTMFKGKTPESWCCMDCGVNTAPGHPNRKELEGLYIRSAVIKKLTGKETPSPRRRSTTDARFTPFAIPCGKRQAWSRWAAASASAVLRSVSAGACGRRILRAIHSTRCPGPDGAADGRTSRDVRRRRYVRRVQRRADAKRSPQAHTRFSLELGYRVLDQKDGGIVVEYE
jgi:hypothetical protein